jgi:hypothetical protein
VGPVDFHTLRMVACRFRHYLERGKPPHPGHPAEPHFAEMCLSVAWSRIISITLSARRPKSKDSVCHFTYGKGFERNKPIRLFTYNEPLRGMFLNIQIEAFALILIDPCETGKAERSSGVSGGPSTSPTTRSKYEKKPDELVKEVRDPSIYGLGC